MFTDSDNLVSHDVWSDRLTKRCLRRTTFTSAYPSLEPRMENQMLCTASEVKMSRIPSSMMPSSVHLGAGRLDIEREILTASLVYFTINHLNQTYGICAFLYLNF